MPHPIPPKPWSAAYEYVLVAIPADRGFMRAAWAAYTDLGDPAWWGLEGLEDDSDDAAQRWLEAIGETFRVMGWTDDLLLLLDEVEPLLRELRDKPCCADTDALTDPIIGVEDDDPGSDVTIGTGDPPGDPTTWPEYNVHFCDAATKFADTLPQWITRLEIASTILNWGLAALIGVVLGQMVAAGMVAASVVGAISITTLYAKLQDISDLFDIGPNWDSIRAELEDADTRQAIICAFVLNDDKASILSALAAVFDTLSSDAHDAVETLPYSYIVGKYLDADPDQRGYGGDCGPCSETPLTTITWTFDADCEDWLSQPGDTCSWVSDDGDPDNGSLDAANGYDARSPNWIAAGGNRVYWSWHCRARAGSHNEQPQLVRASDDVVLASGTNKVINTAWDTESSYDDVTITEGTEVYVRINSDGYMRLDTVNCQIQTV